MSTSDLSGKIIFKVKLDKEIKKIVIHNDDINYNELLLMMQRIFSDRIKPNDEFTIKYTDEENDLITLSNDSDVLLALQNSKILKLTIFLKEEEKMPSEEVSQADIASELHHIRLSIDRFLTKFERSLKLNSAHLSKVEELSQVANDIKLTNSGATNGTSSSHHNINNDLHKEFDPLNKRSESSDAGSQSMKHNITSQQQYVQKNSRAETPDSIGSSEMVSTHQRRQGLNLNGPASNVGQQLTTNTLAQSQPPQVTQQQQPPTILNQDPLQYTASQFNNTKMAPQPQINPQQIPQQQQLQQQHQQQPQGLPNQNQFNQYQYNPSVKQAGPGGIVQPIPQHPSNIGFNNLAQSQNLPVDPQQQQLLYQQQLQQQQQQQQQPQQFYQQPQHLPNAQQGLPPNALQQQQQQHQQQQPQLNSPQLGGPSFPGQSASSNPYSKTPNTSLARPPSATIYQQGYR